MKTLLTLLLAILLLNETVLAQPYLPQLKPYLKNGNDTIHIAGDSVRFKVMNVCTSDLIMGFNSSSGASSFLAIPGFIFGNTAMAVFDSSEMPGSITGVSGYLDYIFGVSFTGTDSFYYRSYSYDRNSGQISRHSHSAIFIGNVLGMLSNNWNQWVLAARVDSSVAYKMHDGLMKMVDSLGIPVAELLDTNPDLYDSHPFNNWMHCFGRTINGEFRYFRFNSSNKQLVHFKIDSIPGNYLYCNANSNYAFIISADSIQTFITYQFGNDSSIIEILDSSRVPIDVNRWDNTELAFLYHVTDTISNKTSSIIDVYDANTWIKIRTISLPLLVNRFYATYSYEYYRNFIVFTDSTGARYISRIRVNGEIESFSAHPFPEVDPNRVNDLHVCFTGIDENTPPPIQTYAYPNPSTDRIEVVIKNVPCDMDHYMELVDLQGRRVYEAKFVSKCDITVPVAHLASGMYILNLHIAGRVYTHKLMKQ